MEYSYLSIDVGFDLRMHTDVVIKLPSDASSVRYEDAANTERMFSGTRQKIIAALVAAGYKVTS